MAEQHHLGSEMTGSEPGVVGMDMWRISADTGGTFTDCFAIDPEGNEQRCKVLSTGCLRGRVTQVAGPSGAMIGLAGLPEHLPDDFFSGFAVRQIGAGAMQSSVQSSRSEGAITWFGLESALGAALDDVVELSSNEEAPVLGARILTGTPLGSPFPDLRLRLATTRATNALLERKGSPTAFFVTQGFGDLLRIGDQRRQDLFALAHQPKADFCAAVCEVCGRMDVEGRELEPVDAEALRVRAQSLVAAGIRHAAVALLHSYASAIHEQQVREVLVHAGFSHVTLSSEIAPFAKILPRAQSAVANAYLTGPIDAFLSAIRRSLGEQSRDLQIMTSAGGLESCQTVQPKDLLLSGPAGGVVGAANAARQLGHRQLITFDMGGTSTDVARIDGHPGWRFQQQVAGMTLMAPCVAIETVAAGGGSICQWTPHGLAVGPESAGSDPGPACYGKGGPLTITDVNLLLGRFDPVRAPIPLQVEPARERARMLLDVIHRETGRAMTEQELLNGCLRMAAEAMADAIRKISVAEGYDPADYAMLAFGGAGPQHACDVADRLGIRTILAPRHAGILSAVGLHEALPERFAERQILQPLRQAASSLEAWLSELAGEARAGLAAVGVSTVECAPPRAVAEVRLSGQEAPLQIAVERPEALEEDYRRRYRELFGYAPAEDRVIELVSLRVSVRQRELLAAPPQCDPADAAAIPGPWLIQDAFSTLVVGASWKVREVCGFGHVLHRVESSAMTTGHRVPDASNLPAPTALERDLLRHRFHSLVEDMGALLCRTAISTNIRERLDFSCALLDAQGRLVVSAPHIPVHLGALGVCVREVARHLPPPRPGDTWITNHPAFGGSHLPDVTLITPVFAAGNSLLIGYVANRAHHAEIGGIAPGSMPAHAVCLAEEGVVIAPRCLIQAGEVHFHEVERLLVGGPHPTRNLADNLADLHAQLAANLLGVSRLQALAAGDPHRVVRGMTGILDHSAAVMRARIHSLPEATAACEVLDDGREIRVAVHRCADDLLHLDFTGTSPVHEGNLNATEAIVSSVVLYVLRLFLQEDLPLNEGILNPVRIDCPKGTLLNPAFTGDALRDPAVVGGNVEVSQRLVDALVRALHLQAGSQGTMNNLLFGNEHFGYYETIAGGAGAGPGYDGASALHTHMTNTAITDAEIIERRYPVRLREFSIRRGSGGSGLWQGGDGVVREFEFLNPLTVSVLTQHRASGPRGDDGGGDGRPGIQTLIRADGRVEVLPASASVDVSAGGRLRMETPGGGGWGRRDEGGA